jgi:hypothetical protein
MKCTASAVTLAAAVLLGPLAVAGTASAQTYYPSCAAAHAVGVSNIHAGRPGYRPALDHDHDGVACEAGGPATGGHGTSVSSTTTEIHGGPSVSSSSSTTVSGSTTTTGSSPQQVAVVPAGGAETGDGSTDGSPWWVGGALVACFAGLVGLLTARPSRTAARR